MIKLDETLISEDLLSEQFVCDLSKCKGACCIEGDAGAPIENSERHTIRNNLEAIKPYMESASRKQLSKTGFYEKDLDGEWVTTCREDGACVFAVNENGTWTCAIEKAWNDGKQPFRKPISCHLYPVRLTELGTYTGVNYDEWDICAPACELGKSLKVPVYKFVKEALMRRFGKEWYQKLEGIADDYLRNNEAKPYSG